MICFQVFNVSATDTFPYLYPNGGRAPLDFRDWRTAQELLKKLLLFAQVKITPEGEVESEHWRFAEDNIHLMWNFAKFQEMRAKAALGFYLSDRPELARLSINEVLDALKRGADDRGTYVLLTT
jgi:hypothetical protein